MKTASEVEALGALAQETRLAVFRLLVAQPPGGLPAGLIAERAQVAPSSLTFHLQHLVRAGLVTRRRAGRQIFYAADHGTVDRLISYLTDNCCGRGTAGLCGQDAVAPAEQAA